MAIFREVCARGSFRAAAKALKLSPSVVSHHISQLENQLGTALLYRSTRRISLTDSGAELFTASERMVDAAQSGLNAIQRRIDQPAGRLRLAVPGALFERPPYIDHLTAFAKRYPKIDLSVSFSDQKNELVGSAFDAAVRIGWLEDSQYLARKLCAISRVLVASPDYVSGRAVPRNISDLESWAWVKLAQMPLTRQLTNRHGETPAIKPVAAIEVDSVAALREMAVGGAGVAALPRVLVRDDLQAGRLIVLSQSWELMAPGAYIVWPNNTVDDSLTRRLVDFLVERMAGA